MDRHEWPNQEDSTRPPLWVTETSTNASEGSLRAEILRLAEENAALQKVIRRDGDIRRVAPVLDAALKELRAVEEERDRLAEEVERLRAETDRAKMAYSNRLDQEDTMIRETQSRERARIRRDLLEEVEAAKFRPDAAKSFHVTVGAFLNTLDRICPEE